MALYTNGHSTGLSDILLSLSPKQINTNIMANLTGMQKLLFCLLMEQLQGDYIRIRKYLTHQICKWVISSLNEEDINYKQTVIYGEDEKYFYIQFAMKTGWTSIIPLSKDWAIANYVRNNIKALTKTKTTKTTKINENIQQEKLHNQSA